MHDGLALSSRKVGRSSDDSVGDGAAQVRLRHLLRVGKQNSRDCLRGEAFALALEHDLDGRLAAVLNDTERPLLKVGQGGAIVEITTKKAFNVVNGVRGISVRLRLGCLSNDTLRFRKRDPRWRESVAEAVGYELKRFISPYADTTARRAQIDCDGVACGFECRHRA